MQKSIIKRSSGFRIFLLCLIPMLWGCNKKKIFDGPDSFSTGFEAEQTYDDLFPEDESNWSYTQITREENRISLDTQIVHSGRQSLRFEAVKSTEEALSKCSIAKQNMAFWEGETVQVSAWYYLQTTDPLPWIFLMDVEEQVPVGAGPGIRVAVEDSSDALIIEHKYAQPNLPQDADNKQFFPRNQWFNIVLQLSLSQKNKGSIRLWQDGTEIINQQDWQTLPRDILYFQQGTLGRYSSVELGVTANTSRSDVVLYLDDVEVSLVN